MKTVLCFGDSNTFGYIPGGVGRYDETERYTGILSSLLGDNYNVIENGIVGRTTIFNDPYRDGKCGINDIEKSVRDANPDIFVIALGTNDVKQAFNNSELDIKVGVESIINLVLDIKPNTEIIIMTPTPISRDALDKSNDYNEYSLSVSAKLHIELEILAHKHGYSHINIGALTRVSAIDGEHLSIEGHSLIAHKLYNVIKSITTKCA